MTRATLSLVAAVAAAAMSVTNAQQLPPGFSADILNQLPVPPQQAPAPTQAPAPIDPNNPIPQPLPAAPASAPQPASIPAGLEGLASINFATQQPSQANSVALPTISLQSPPSTTAMFSTSNPLHTSSSTRPTESSGMPKSTMLSSSGHESSFESFSDEFGSESMSDEFSDSSKDDTTSGGSHAKVPHMLYAGVALAVGVIPFF
ncbi:hypothetical protein H4217_005628 [Coemansia sp. RSA 1939]|nr:hypothetical protein H4217_005628 [Coemansia sp. RSA 1939]KAJ2600990.1 hypothetical protein EV177_007053 [Coemansia sp. RSA 1804]KAJ2667566.1 hypothetical protein GGH99_006643 [Coemansia sp. RSA 1285]